ncbi:hypothetical protein ACIBI9_65795 [Nonomuraea sp. NPDC050451]|uniref:hypothetical protein n=1 Tax=Nonomuraea sp. NPDC050451 TaxID=3364364 RepID=UPI0037B69B89
MTSARLLPSGGPRPRPRARALAGAGLALAVIAELSSAGLLGLSGWFISACAVAGAATFSSFSYIAPSGGVRALALARIAGNYSRRLTLHAAALRASPPPGPSSSTRLRPPSGAGWTACGPVTSSIAAWPMPTTPGWR